MSGLLQRRVVTPSHVNSTATSHVAYSPKHLSILHNAAVSEQSIASRKVSASLGNLSALPTELLFDILSRLDLATLRTISSISAQAFALTSALSFYQFLLRDCPSLVNVLLATGVAAHYPLSKLKELLTTRSCAFCGENGTLLLLARAQRCCEMCLSGKEAEVVNVEWITRRYNLGERDLTQLPQVRAQPGLYAGARGQFALSAPASSPLVSVSLATRLFSPRTSPKQAEEVDPHLALLPSFPAPQAEHAFLPAPGLHPPKGSPAVPRVLKLLAPAYANMCATPLPWVGEGKEEGKKWRIETPVYCMGCLQAANGRPFRGPSRRKVWSMAELVEHTQQCSLRKTQSAIRSSAAALALGQGLSMPPTKLLAV